MSTAATHVISWMEEIFAETALVEVEDAAITPTRWHEFLEGWEELNTAVAFAEENEMVPPR